MSIIRNKPLAFRSRIPVESGWSPDPGDGLTAASSPAPLEDLPCGQVAQVLALQMEHGLRHRLQALGLRPGQRVQVLRRAPWGGPIHLQVGMTELMLRRRDAARITVRIGDRRP
ncbi:MAG: ferrous iron transport protein A [Cyanobium sp.]